jgi:hypothetical protein
MRHITLNEYVSLESREFFSDSTFAVDGNCYIVISFCTKSQRKWFYYLFIYFRYET